MISQVQTQPDATYPALSTHRKLLWKEREGVSLSCEELHEKRKEEGLRDEMLLCVCQWGQDRGLAKLCPTGCGTWDKLITRV